MKYLYLSILILVFPPSPLDAQSKDEIEAAYLQKANENIEKYRKGDAIIQFLDSDGNAAPNIQVEIQQKSHDFYFGSLLDIQYVKNPYKPEYYLKRFQDLFNFATIEMYWGYFEPKQGHPRYPENEEILQWCKLNQIKIIGHALVWTHWHGVPKWLSNYSSEIQKDLLKAWVVNTIGDTKGKLIPGIF